MGLFDGIMGNAIEANRDKVIKELGVILIEGEQVILSFKLVRDLIVFTNLRLIIVDK